MNARRLRLGWLLALWLALQTGAAWHAALHAKSAPQARPLGMQAGVASAAGVDLGHQGGDAVCRLWEQALQGHAPSAPAVLPAPPMASPLCRQPAHVGLPAGKVQQAAAPRGPPAQG